jgi:hypothetical protein
MGMFTASTAYHISHPHDQDNMTTPTSQSGSSQQPSTSQQTLRGPSQTATQRSARTQSALPSLGTFWARHWDKNGQPLFKGSLHGDLDYMVIPVDPTEPTRGSHIFSVYANPDPLVGIEVVQEAVVGGDSWFGAGEVETGYILYEREDQNRPGTVTYGVDHRPQQPTPDPSPPPSMTEN